jgi:hypothetical protein
MDRTNRSARTFVAVLMVVAGAACSKGDSKGAQTAERAEETSGEMSQTESLRATVQSVDEANRTVTLRDEKGRPFEVEAGPGVELSRLHANDTVLVVYQESIAFALQDPKGEKAEEPETVEESTRRRIPDGVQFGRQIRTTVEIISVAADGTEATIRVPEGAVRTVQVADAGNRQKVANLRPGDSVEVTYTERLNVAVDPANK